MTETAENIAPVEPKAKVANTAATWPRGPELYDLPSGAVVSARRANFYLWMKTGQIPDKHMAVLRSIAQSGDVTLEERMEVMQWALCKCVDSFTMEPDPEGDDIYVYDVDDMDRNFLIVVLGIELG